MCHLTTMKNYRMFATDVFWSSAAEGQEAVWSHDNEGTPLLTPHTPHLTPHLSTGPHTPSTALWSNVIVILRLVLSFWMTLPPDRTPPPDPRLPFHATEDPTPDPHLNPDPLLQPYGAMLSSSLAYFHSGRPPPLQSPQPLTPFRTLHPSPDPIHTLSHGVLVTYSVLTLISDLI